MLCIYVYKSNRKFLICNIYNASLYKKYTINNTKSYNSYL